MAHTLHPAPRTFLDRINGWFTHPSTEPHAIEFACASDGCTRPATKLAADIRLCAEHASVLTRL